MEEKFKLYSQKAIIIATFFGGPVAAGILIRKNSLNLGREKEGLIALIIGITSTIILIVSVFWTSDPIIDKVANTLIPPIYMLIIAVIVDKIYGQILKKHKEENNEFYSNWRAAGIGFACSIVIFGGAFTYAYFAPDDWDYETYNYEITKVDNNLVEATEFFNIEFRNPSEALYFIEHKGIPKLKENIEILDEISTIEDMPDFFQKQIELLREYCMLRIETYELISKAVLNETSEYDEKIFRKNVRIDEIDEALSKKRL